MRKTPLAAFAFAAALGAAAPDARAAVISVSSNQEQSPEYPVSGGGTGRLQGTVTGSASGVGSSLFPDGQPAVILPSLRFEPLDGAARVYALAP